MTAGKTIALTRWTFVGKVISLLFNMLSRLVITFLPRSKRLLIWWLQSPSAVILEPRKIKSVTVSTVSPSICHEVMGADAMILVCWMLSFKPTFSLSSRAQDRSNSCYTKNSPFSCWIMGVPKASAVQNIGRNTHVSQHSSCLPTSREHFRRWSVCMAVLICFWYQPYI